MEKTILVAGKDMPECTNFCDALSQSKRRVAAASAEAEIADDVKKTVSERKIQMESYSEAKNIEAQSGICTFEWNKSSSLSTRSFILQTENVFEHIDEAVLYFDEEWFASHAEKMDTEEVSRCADEMLLGFQNLTLELIARFEKNFEDKPQTLVFMLNECPCVADAVRVPSLRDGSVGIASPLVASCASAFSTFAENIAAMYGDSPFLNVVLIRSDCTQEKSLTESQTGSWLAEYLDEVSELKNKLTAKKSLQWVKAGGKLAGSPFEGLNLGKFFKK